MSLSPINLLASNAVLLCALVLGVGHLLGSIRIRGVALGVAAVFFVGLGVGALDERLRLPDFADQFGLALFVYLIGLAAGPTFFVALRRRGLRDNAFVAGVLAVASLTAVGAANAFHLNPATAAGVFAGALVNVPALGGAQEALRAVDPTHAGSLASDAAVGMSLTYGYGVVAMIGALITYMMFVRVDFAREAAENEHLAPAPRTLVQLTLRVTRGAGTDIRELTDELARDGDVLLVRLRRGDRVLLATTVAALDQGDLLSVVGTRTATGELVARLGEKAWPALSLDRGALDFRRITVSDPALVGTAIADLDLLRRHGALITRVRRGDHDLIATPVTRLLLGDRVRVVAPRDQMSDVTALLGDSDQSLARVDFTGLTLGLALGLLLGAVAVPLAGGATLRLGLAAGPLIVGLILGRVGRTGPITWQQPRSTILVLRQVGVALFFAGVGLKSGGALVRGFSDGGAWKMIAVGALVAAGTAVACIAVGRLLRMPLSWLMGVMAGIDTNPAVLTFAEDRAKNELPALAYSMAFPVAMVLKVLIAQLMVVLLSHQ
ncbi:aspartate:alanine exchanger family transporter [Paractinoplanes durhamensis]|uniref:Transporter n=1 Tax=Paractinoplanes durhamensis TaxID=113563 RepID=A0ABQ3YXT3_9ACTN|nr:TrkA C-terminal domain-containing protein [Actinoplanes durhamensis]GIE02400.1 transporter [Actinoplanes durhamensis]